MKFIQYYLDCLSHASYLVADKANGVPSSSIRTRHRRVRCRRRGGGCDDRRVIETHFHADFVPVTSELARPPVAEIVYSSVAEASSNRSG